MCTRALMARGLPHLNARRAQRGYGRVRPMQIRARVVLPIQFRPAEAPQLRLVRATLALPGSTGTHARRVRPDNTKLDLDLQCARVVPPIQFRPVEAP